MRKIILFFQSLGAYFKGLFSPSLPVKKYSENGYAVLKGWEKAPEEKLITDSKHASSQENKTSLLSLYCFEGAHQGETLHFNGPSETIGVTPHHSVVLTPSRGQAVREFRLLVNGATQLMAEVGDHYLLNGVETQSSELFDYDELDVMGNKFLVLNVAPFRKEA